MNDKYLPVLETQAKLLDKTIQTAPCGQEIIVSKELAEYMGLDAFTDFESNKNDE